MVWGHCDRDFPVEGRGRHDIQAAVAADGFEFARQNAFDLMFVCSFVVHRDVRSVVQNLHSVVCSTTSMTPPLSACPGGP